MYKISFNVSDPSFHTVANAELPSVHHPRTFLQHTLVPLLSNLDLSQKLNISIEIEPLPEPIEPLVSTSEVPSEVPSAWPIEE